MNYSPAKEPVSWNVAITALAVATIPVLRSFSIDISEAQSDALLGLLAALMIVAGLFVRSKVTPTAKANEKITEAYELTPGQGKAVPTI